MSAQPYAGLLERLVAVESSASDFIGDPNPKYVTCWHRNPDGPEAAEAISSLLKALEAAYREGWDASRDEGGYIYQDDAWEHSKARAALNSDAPQSTDVEGRDVMIGEFVARWEDAADGVMMDADTAQELARAFKDLSSRPSGKAIMDEIDKDPTISTDAAIRVYAAIKRAALNSDAPRPTTDVSTDGLVQGTAADALDFALDHLESDSVEDFLEDWRMSIDGDRLEAWPEYLSWLAFQRTCAAES